MGIYSFYAVISLLQALYAAYFMLVSSPQGLNERNP
jgi:hypothetical protein